jgi:hypothetical protein
MATPFFGFRIRKENGAYIKSMQSTKPLDCPNTGTRQIERIPAVFANGGAPKLRETLSSEKNSPDPRRSCGGSFDFGD